jgi:hypothetical protein
MLSNAPTALSRKVRTVDGTRGLFTPRAGWCIKSQRTTRARLRGPRRDRAPAFQRSRRRVRARPKRARKADRCALQRARGATAVARVLAELERARPDRPLAGGAAVLRPGFPPRSERTAPHARDAITPPSGKRAESRTTGAPARVDQAANAAQRAPCDRSYDTRGVSR